MPTIAYRTVCDAYYWHMDGRRVRAAHGTFIRMEGTSHCLLNILYDYGRMFVVKYPIVDIEPRNAPCQR